MEAHDDHLPYLVLMVAVCCSEFSRMGPTLWLRMVSISPHWPLNRLVAPASPIYSIPARPLQPSFIPYSIEAP
jgi:hypothetical protein